MPRGWMASLALSVSLVAAAAVMQATRPPAQEAEVPASADPCFSYGRFECCVRP